MILITQMYLACAPSQLPDEDGIEAMARAWAPIVIHIPPQHLEATYLRAMARHSTGAARTFPLNAPELVAAWAELGPELVELAARYPANRPALPAPHTGPLAESNTLPGVLAELAHAWGEWDTEGRSGGVTLSQVLKWVGPLQTAYPEIPPGAMRLQLQKMRLGGVTSLAGAVAQLLTEAAPPMEEAE